MRNLIFALMFWLLPICVQAQTLGPMPQMGIPLLGYQSFTASGTYTPNPNATTIYVIVVAQGGGGGGCASTTIAQNCIAGSGGAGSYATAYFTNPTAQTITVGTAGSGGSAGNNNGTAGGTTSFGTLISCPGGVAGSGGAAFTATTGSIKGITGSMPSSCTITGTSASLSFPGTSPNFSQSLGVLGVAFSSPGASSLYGSGGAGVSGNGAGILGMGFGSGGSGGVSSNGGAAVAGGNPGGGNVIVEEYGQ